MPASKKTTRRKDDPLTDKRKVKGTNKLPEKLAKRNEEEKKERVRRNRQAGAAIARKAKMEKAGNLPVEKTEFEAYLAETMETVPPEIRDLIAEHRHNPLDALFRYAKHAKDKKGKMEVNKFLANKMLPNLKAVDVQKKMDMTVKVTVTSFKDASQEALKNVTPKAGELSDEDYREFEEGDEEDEE